MTTPSAFDPLRASITDTTNRLAAASIGIRDASGRIVGCLALRRVGT